MLGIIVVKSGNMLRVIAKRAKVWLSEGFLGSYNTFRE